MGEPSFTPASRFGVPLHQFPPGLPWSALRDLLLDATADLRRDWVRSHVLAISPAVGLSVLSASSQLSKSVAVSFRGHRGPNPISSSGLFVPTLTRDGLTIGVGIEANHTPRIPVEVWPKGCRLRVYSRNTRTGAICLVSHDDVAAIVDMSFHTVRELSSSRYIEMRFCAPRFFAAFAGGEPDLAALERCIMSSWVGYSARLTAGCGCAMQGCIECCGESAIPSPLPMREVFSDVVEAGDYTLKAVLGFYDDGKLVKATPTFAVMSRQARMASGTLRDMVGWGVRDCIRRQKPVVPCSVFVTYMGKSRMSCAHCAIDSILSERLHELPEAENDANSVTEEGQKRIAATIASAQDPLSDENVNAGTCVELTATSAWPTNASSLQTTKLELRKIRNRESAFRASAKRSERRRLARIAKQATKNAQHGGDSIHLALAALDDSRGL